MPESEFKIPREFLLVIVAVFALVLQYVITMYAVAMATRCKVFNRKFMSKFDKEHTKAFPNHKESPEFGYPDCGNGRYSKQLPYADWFAMANAQRCQVNFLEHLCYAIVMPLLVGLNYPSAGLYLAGAVFVGRLMFTIGYNSKGPKGRMAGALTMDLALFVGFGYLIASMMAMIR